MCLKKRAIVLTGRIACLIFFTVGMAAPAEAATGPGGRVITCQLAVHYPHNSGHVNGTINVTSDPLCKGGIVDQLYSSTGLRGAQSSNDWAQKYNDTYVSSNAARPCKDGTYRGIGSGTVTFPAGFTPRTASLEGSGATKTINCSKQSSAQNIERSSSSVSSGTGSTADEDVVYVEVSAVETSG